MNKWERRQQFERFMQLKAQHDPNRVVPADGWTPDTSMLDLVTIARENERMARANAEMQAQTDAWYRGA